MKKEKAERIYKAIMLIVLTALITFIITSSLMYNNDKKLNVKYITTSDNISSTFNTFHSFIERNYLGDINEEEMLESAIKGYVAGLNDEYSEYITKKEMDEYMQDTIGKYVGVGVYIYNNTETNQIEILMPIKGAPAEQAGLKSGDVILKVDDVEYKGEDIDACSSALKSEEGTIAKLEILRDGQILNIDVERKTIKVNHIETQIIDNKIAYMDIATFDDGCYEEFAEKWEAIRQNNSNITGLIIDLRNNGGGIVTEATDIANMMTNKDKTLLVIEGKNEQEEVVKAKTDKIINIPIVILVNGETANASEILTAAVKENNENVTIVGNKTYGKGIIQTIYTLTDGSGLKLTTNEYYTPNGNSIHKIGITPDYEVEFPEGKTKYTIEQKDDTQLQKALEILK